MSKSSRRKTLSHSEIENFLSDISVSKSDENVFSNNNLPQNKPDKSNHIYSEVIEMTESVAGDEKQWIREICKIKFANPLSAAMLSCETVCELGRKIFDSSSYPVIPSRKMRPELFKFSASSLEGKKQLLMSLSPMLSENENQRKADTAACEEYTRCRSTKGKGRFSAYEYIDIDSQLRVDFAEFEQRYLMFIHDSQKKFLSQLYSTSNTYIPSNPSSPVKPYIPEMNESVVSQPVHMKELPIFKRKTDVTVFEQSSTIISSPPPKSYTSMHANTFASRRTSIASPNSNMIFEDKSASTGKSHSEVCIGSPYVIGSPQIPSKKTRDDKKRKTQNDTAAERRVTLSPATMRAEMLRAFAEDEPTVFPACPLKIDHELGGSNIYVSPSRMLRKEITVSDVFSNPNYIDSVDEEVSLAPTASDVVTDLQSSVVYMSDKEETVGRARTKSRMYIDDRTCESLTTSDFLFAGSSDDDFYFSSSISDYCFESQQLSSTTAAHDSAVPQEIVVDESDCSLDDLMQLSDAFCTHSSDSKDILLDIKTTVTTEEEDSEELVTPVVLSCQLDSLLEDTQDIADDDNYTENDELFLTGSPSGYHSTRQSQLFCFGTSHDSVSPLLDMDMSSPVTSTSSASPHSDDDDLSPLFFDEMVPVTPVVTLQKNGVACDHPMVEAMTPEDTVMSPTTNLNCERDTTIEVIVSSSSVVVTESKSEDIFVELLIAAYDSSEAKSSHLVPVDEEVEALFNSQQEASQQVEQLFGSESSVDANAYDEDINSESSLINVSEVDLMTGSVFDASPVQAEVVDNLSAADVASESHDFVSTVPVIQIVQSHVDLDVSLLDTPFKGSSSSRFVTVDNDEDDFELLEGLIERGESNPHIATTSSLYAFCNSVSSVSAGGGCDEEDSDALLEAELRAFEEAEDCYVTQGAASTPVTPATKTKRDMLSPVMQTSTVETKYMRTEEVTQPSPQRHCVVDEVTSTEDSSGNSSSGIVSDSSCSDKNDEYETVTHHQNTLHEGALYVADADVKTSIATTIHSAPDQSFDFIYNAPLDFALAQEKAYKNRLERFEIARNKYQWEIVSARAANAAIERARALAKTKSNSIQL